MCRMRRASPCRCNGTLNITRVLTLSRARCFRPLAMRRVHGRAVETLDGEEAELEVAGAG